MRVPGLGTILDRHERGFYCRWRRKGHADMLRKAGTERNAKRILSLVQARRLDGATLEAAVRSVFGDPEPVGMTPRPASDYLTAPPRCRSSVFPPWAVRAGYKSAR